MWRTVAGSLRGTAFTSNAINRAARGGAPIASGITSKARETFVERVSRATDALVLGWSKALFTILVAS